MPDTQHCDQWTSDSFKALVIVGVNALPDGSPELEAWAKERWWTRYVELSCKDPQWLYCFEN